MANYQFTSDLIDDVLFRVGEPTDGTSDFEAEALRLINRAYRAVWMGGGEFVEGLNEAWLWLKKDPPGVITLLPSITAGTVAVTNNSTSITFSSAPAASVAGYHFRTDDDDTVYRIASHTGGAAGATLDAPYVFDTNAAATYRLMKLEYTLAADVLRLISPMTVQGSAHDEIEGIDLAALSKNYPLTVIEGGIPDKFAHVTETKIRFNRYGGDESDEFSRVEYDYLQKPADLTNSGSEEPLIPLQHRHILADIAVFYLFTTKGDDRVDIEGAKVRAGLRAMKADNRARQAQIGRGVGQIYQRGQAKPLRQRLFIAR